MTHPHAMFPSSPHKAAPGTVDVPASPHSQASMSPRSPASSGFGHSAVSPQHSQRERAPSIAGSGASTPNGVAAAASAPAARGHSTSLLFRMVPSATIPQLSQHTDLETVTGDFHGALWCRAELVFNHIVGTAQMARLLWHDVRTALDTRRQSHVLWVTPQLAPTRSAASPSSVSSASSPTAATAPASPSASDLAVVSTAHANVFASRPPLSRPTSISSVDSNSGSSHSAVVGDSESSPLPAFASPASCKPAPGSSTNIAVLPRGTITFTVTDW